MSWFSNLQGGSKEESSLPLANFVATEINTWRNYHQDVILDDRTSLTIGKKLIEAKQVGYPYIVIVGKKAIEQVPKLELIDLNRNEQKVLTVEELFNCLKECNSLV